jgi:hypothetical protein
MNRMIIEYMANERINELLFDAGVSPQRRVGTRNASIQRLSILARRIKLVRPQRKFVNHGFDSQVSHLSSCQ